MDQLSTAPPALGQPSPATDPASINRRLMRGVEPDQLIAELLAATLQTLAASYGGVHKRATDTWIVSGGTPEAILPRLQRLRPLGPAESLLELSIDDSGEQIARLVLVVSTRLDPLRKPLDVDSLMEELTLLVLASISSRQPAPVVRMSDRDEQLLTEIRRDLLARRFVPHFQPVIDFRTGAVRAFEALARWNHPIRGWVNAAEFLDVAERSGAIVDIGQVVFERAAERARRWLDRGTKDVRVNVKASAAQIASPTIGQELAKLSIHNCLPAGTLGLLLDASVLSSDAGRALIPKIRDCGVRVAVEHLGPNPSLLTRLHDVPLHAVKIDRSLVARLGDDPANDRTVRGIIQVAKSIGIRTIGEGVETAAQADALVRMGCDAGQGYYWSPAVECEVADTMMRFQQFRNRVAPHHRTV